MQLTLIIFLALVPSITALKCYFCNSAENPQCNDVSSLASFEDECHVSNDPYCRVVTQTVNGEKDIVRSCGSGKTSKTCYKTAGRNNVKVCSCTTDLCNSSPSFNRQQQIIVMSFSSIMMMTITMMILR